MGRMTCVLAVPSWLVVLLALVGEPNHVSAQPTVYKNEHFDVTVSNNTVYGQGLTCSGDKYDSSCLPMDLLVDVYQPLREKDVAAMPAVLLVHGGGFVGGTKEFFIPAATWYAQRGFVAFSVMYRLAGAHGVYPGMRGLKDEGVLGGPVPYPAGWYKAYPAMRDVKAAIRFVRANSAAYNIDPSRVLLSGGSAGASACQAAAMTWEDDFTRELTEAQDPTLKGTHLDQSGRPTAVVVHWGEADGALLAQMHDKQNRSRCSPSMSPQIEYHGDADVTVPIERAHDVQAMYAEQGADYELHVLPGCGHAAWCAQPDPALPKCAAAGPGGCNCQKGGFCDAMDVAALPWVARHLNLTVSSSDGAAAAEVTV